MSWTSSHTPVFERFYAGGFRSMRGFEFRGVGPVISGFEIGGDFEWLNSLEYQVPILATDHLYGVVFVDSGAVERTVGTMRVTTFFSRSSRSGTRGAISFFLWSLSYTAL